MVQFARDLIPKTAAIANIINLALTDAGERGDVTLTRLVIDAAALDQVRGQALAFGSPPRQLRGGFIRSASG
jgi:hypothetical protein